MTPQRQRLSELAAERRSIMGLPATASYTSVLRAERRAVGACVACGARARQGSRRCAECLGVKRIKSRVYNRSRPDAQGNGPRGYYVCGKCGGEGHNRAGCET